MKVQLSARVVNVEEVNHYYSANTKPKEYTTKLSINENERKIVGHIFITDTTFLQMGVSYSVIVDTDVTVELAPLVKEVTA